MCVHVCVCMCVCMCVHALTCPSAFSCCVLAPVMSLEQYRAVADYKKQDKNELTFKTGDVFDVVEKNDNGWCVCMRVRACVCVHVCVLFVCDGHVLCSTRSSVSWYLNVGALLPALPNTPSPPNVNSPTASRLVVCHQGCGHAGLDPSHIHRAAGE